MPHLVFIILVLIRDLIWMKTNTMSFVWGIKLKALLGLEPVITVGVPKHTDRAQAGFYLKVLHRWANWLFKNTAVLFYIAREGHSITTKSERLTQTCVCRKSFLKTTCVTVIFVSLPISAASEMCTPHTPNKCRFCFLCFFCCEFCESSSRRPQMIQDYEQHNRQKSNDARQNLNRKAVSGEFTSSWSGKLM